ncbi:hypothetical protein ISCGN_018658 [Ixodes scapularis]
MPLPSTLKRTIRKQRQKSQNPYVLPKLREEIVISEEYKVRMLPALAFLPPSEVPDAFDGLLEVFPTEVPDLAMYFGDTYIGRRRFILDLASKCERQHLHTPWKRLPLLAALSEWSADHCGSLRSSSTRVCQGKPAGVSSRRVWWENSPYHTSAKMQQQKEFPADKIAVGEGEKGRAVKHYLGHPASPQIVSGPERGLPSPQERTEWPWIPYAVQGPLRTASETPVYEKQGPKWCIASPGGPRRVQTYPGLGSTTRMPFSPDTGQPRTATRGRANPRVSGSVVTPLTKHLLSQVFTALVGLHSAVKNRFIDEYWQRSVQLGSFENAWEVSFLGIAGFPRVLGRIDGTHVAVKVSKKDKPVYLNRKEYTSINVQAPWIMTPIRVPKDEPEEEYNKALTETRQVIERTFGFLKSRFRCLDKSGRVHPLKPQICCRITAACVVLHNYCMRHHVFLNEPLALQQPASFHGPPALDGRHLQGSHRGPGQQPYNYWRSRQDVDVVGDFEVIDCHQEDDACCCCGAPVVTPPSAGGDNGPGRRQEHRASRVTLLTTETRRGTSTVPHGAADSSDMEASGGQGSPPNSQAEELGTTLEIEREKTLQAQILLQQLEVQLKMTELTAIRGARAGVGERDPGIERGEALKHYSKMLHGAIPKFPQEAEVPVWFETVECLFERYAVPHEIQAHLVYPLIANRLAYLCAGMKDGEFTFAHLRSVVLAELRLSADEYRKRFSTAFKKRDETWKQFSTRLASYLQYYLEARDVKDFPKLTSLLVADRMKEAMGEDAREYVILREGKEWLSPADIADLLAVYNAAKSAPRGQGAGEKRGAGAENRFHDGGRNDQKRPTGDGRPPARPSNAPLRSWRNCDMCGSPSHRAAECPRAREPKPSASGARVQNVELRETGSDRLTLRVSKVLEEQPAPSALTHVHVMCGGQVIQALVDSGAEITVVRESLLPIEVGEPSGSVTLVSAFGQKVNAKLVTLPMWLLTELDAPTSQKVHETVSVICALTDDLAPHTDCLLALDAWEALSTSARRDTTPPGADTFGGAQSAGAVGLVKEADGATDSAESPTERENACQAETPRAEPRAPDVGPALSGAGC